MDRKDSYYYNGSGYFDPTAGKALSRVDKESKRRRRRKKKKNHADKKGYCRKERNNV